MEANHRRHHREPPSLVVFVSLSPPPCLCVMCLCRKILHGFEISCLFLGRFTWLARLLIAQMVGRTICLQRPCCNLNSSNARWIFKNLPLFPTSFWSNYSDLTRPHPKWWFTKGIPLISGKSRLVKYYNLARKICLCSPHLCVCVFLCVTLVPCGFVISGYTLNFWGLHIKYQKNVPFMVLWLSDIIAYLPGCQRVE